MMRNDLSLESCKRPALILFTKSFKAVSLSGEMCYYPGFDSLVGLRLKKTHEVESAFERRRTGRFFSLFFFYKDNASAA